MTIFDLRCDRCGTPLAGLVGGDGSGPNQAVRFRYHPGRKDLADDAGMLCRACWSNAVAWFGPPGADRCSRCGRELRYEPSLYVNEAGDSVGWRLCRDDALEFLNSLRTVEPKLEASSFVLPSE